MKYGLEDIWFIEIVNLFDGNLWFIVVESDGSFCFIIDGVWYDWFVLYIFVSVICMLVFVFVNKEIFFVDFDCGEIL